MMTKEDLKGLDKKATNEKQSIIRRQDRALARKFQKSAFQEAKLVGELKKLYDNIKSAMCGKIKVIDITGYSVKDLIAVDYFISRDIIEPIINDKSKVKKLQPYDILMAGIRLRITPKAHHGHLGNCLVERRFCSEEPYVDVGDTYKKINEELNIICRGDDDKAVQLNERALARMMLEFISKGSHFIQIIQDDPEKTGVYLTDGEYAENEYFNNLTIVLSNEKKVCLSILDSTLEQFTAICYLVCVKEVSRRMASEKYFKNNHYGKNLPFFCRIIPWLAFSRERSNKIS